jgi:peptide/nickel transport system substrate-binding protein
MLPRALTVPNALLAALLLTIVGCAPSPQGSRSSTTSERAPTRPNVPRVAVTGDSHVFHERLKPVSDNPAGAYVNAGLAADGTMKTTLTLRPDLKWQDGQPLTSADVAFAYRVYRDREIPLMTKVARAS